MAVSLEEITAHYAALLATRRGRAFVALSVAILVIFTLANITNRGYHQPSINLDRVSKKKKNGTDWSKFAYIQYATNSEYLCNAVMLLQSLHHLKSRADRVLMYPEKMLPDPEDMDGGGFQEGELLVKARDEYGVKLVPIQLQHKDTIDGACIFAKGRRVKLLLILSQTHGPTLIPSCWLSTRLSTSVSLPSIQTQPF